MEEDGKKQLTYFSLPTLVITKSMLNISPTKDAYLGGGSIESFKTAHWSSWSWNENFQGQNDPNYIGNGASASLEEN